MLKDQLIMFHLSELREYDFLIIVFIFTSIYEFIGICLNHLLCWVDPLERNKLFSWRFVVVQTSWPATFFPALFLSWRSRVRHRRLMIEIGNAAYFGGREDMGPPSH